MYPAANLFTSVFLTLQYNLLHPMSKLCLVVVLILMAGRIYAQDYFVLIEADNGQPFYVRVDSQYYSSSARGHLILSHLKDSSYIITIGFPGQVFPERQFSFSVHQNDHAFRLKNEEGKGWWLVDDKGQELAMLNGNGGGTSARIPGIKKDDAFSRLMADVVKDTAVMYTTFTIEQPNPSPAASSVTPASGTPTSTSTNRLARDSSANFTAADSATAARSVTKPIDSTDATHSGMVSSVDSAMASSRPRDTSVVVHPGVTTPVDSAAVRRAAVRASDSSAAAHGFNNNPATAAVVSPGADSAAGHTANTPLYRPIPRKDTATTAIPLASASAPPASTPEPLPSAAAPLYRTTGVTMLTEHRSARSLRQVYTDHDSNGKSDTVVIIIPLDTPAQSDHPAVTSVSRIIHPASPDSSHLTAPQGHSPNPDTPALSSARTPGKSTLTFVNSDCHNFATDYDVDKLRVKMLESAKDDDRILSAHKVFKTKCFSTRQIRALSEVFTTDGAKFRFLEAAYPFVSDDHFAELSNLLADPVYSGRFRAMTSHP
jgi:hypothetical protein